MRERQREREREEKRKLSVPQHFGRVEEPLNYRGMVGPRHHNVALLSKARCDAGSTEPRRFRQSRPVCGDPTTETCHPTGLPGNPSGLRANCPPGTEKGSHTSSSTSCQRAHMFTQLICEASPLVWLITHVNVCVEGLEHTCTHACTHTGHTVKV